MSTALRKRCENKWLYGWKLYVNYGNGWEYETFEVSRKAMLENKKAYLRDCKYPQRWSRGRETNPNWVPLSAQIGDDNGIKC